MTSRLLRSIVAVASLATACEAPLDGAATPPPSSSPSNSTDPGAPQTEAGGPERLEGPGGPSGGPTGGPTGTEIMGRRFSDVTERAGLAVIGHGFVPGYTATGQAFGDVDGDGDPDLYVTDSLGENVLYQNAGDGTFEVAEASAQVSLPEHASGGAIFADYDNDGDQDLYVLGKGPNVLFENQRGGFVDVTERAGVGDPGMGQTASWADYDNDGHLDLYVANWQCLDCGLREGRDSRTDRLFHSEGDGTFTDVTRLLGPSTDGFGFVGGFTDIDDDGDLDLYVVNDKGYAGPPRPDAGINRNVLYRNDGPGCDGWCFTEIAERLGADARVDGMGLAIADIDGDLDLDFFFTDTHHPVLLRRDEAGFVATTSSAGIDLAIESWGAVFFDHDNDADPDLYVAVGELFGPTNPNPLYDNQGDGTFVDVSATSGATQPRYSMGVAKADVDADGWVDLLVGNYAAGYRLLRNNGAVQHDHHWLTVRLTGGGAVNRDAVGTRVWLEDSEGRRQVREVRAGSSHGAGHDLALHFGLGEATPVAIEIRWPDGLVERVEDLPVDQEWRHAHPG